MSIVELSHRSKTFADIRHSAEQQIRELLNVPVNYKVLFMQGGGTTQFSCVPLNLSGGDASRKALYIVSGCWSKAAASEAKRYTHVDTIATSGGGIKCLPITSDWKLEDDSYDYVYYCDNETVDGVEFNFIPNVPSNVHLVSDMSSNIMSREFDISKFSIVFAGAQKNIGPTGLVIVIVRDDVLQYVSPECPLMLQYPVMAETDSMKNTPPTFAVYFCDKVFSWVKSHGNVTAMERNAKEKSNRLYQFIEKSKMFKCLVSPSARSRMNVCFDFINADDDILDALVVFAKQRGIVGIKGHRSVGGLRVALYNAITVEDVDILIDCLQSFHSNA